MEDSEIIELYWKRDQNAISATMEKYGSYCFSVANKILQDREDAQECVNDALFRAWSAMPPYRPIALRMFLAKLTRRIAFDRFRAGLAKKRGGGEIEPVLDELAQCIPDRFDVESRAEANELGEFIKRFIGDLPDRERNIFLRRYFFADSVADIAKRFNLSESNVGVILSRSRVKLRRKLLEEGFFDE